MMSAGVDGSIGGAAAAGGADAGANGGLACGVGGGGGCGDVSAAGAARRVQMVETPWGYVETRAAQEAAAGPGS
eukprot:792469-Prymnesium_polylepis.1